MKKLALSALLVATLTLSACGGGKTATVDEATVTQGAETVAKGAFDKPVEVAKGVTVTLSKAATFKPGQYATGYVAGDTAFTFDVTVDNASAKEVSAAYLSLMAASGSVSCVDIFDGDNGLQGAPTDPIAAGKSAQFTWALDCSTAKSGDPLTVTLSFDGGSNVDITGMVP